VGSRKRIYNAEFREGAVRIVKETGKPVPEVAEELGVHPGTLGTAAGTRHATVPAGRMVLRPCQGRRGREFAGPVYEDSVPLPAGTV
jgi:transposase